MGKPRPSWHNYHTYLHYIEATDQYKQDLSSDWQGVARRVQQMLDVQRLKQSEELDSKMVDLHKALEETVVAQDNKQLAAVYREMQSLNAQVGELLSKL